MYIKQGLIENMSTKIGDTIWILLMITIITIVGVCCVTIAKWGIIGYGVVSFISFVFLIYGLILIWTHKDKRNIINKNNKNWKP